MSLKRKLLLCIAMGSEHLRDGTIRLSIVYTNEGTRVPLLNTGGWRLLDEKNRIQVDLAFAKHVLKTALITTDTGTQLRKGGGDQTQTFLAQIFSFRLAFFELHTLWSCRSFSLLKYVCSRKHIFKSIVHTVAADKLALLKASKTI